MAGAGDSVDAEVSPGNPRTERQHKMKLLISKRYLRIPVRRGADKVYFVFRKGGETAYLFEAELNAEDPETVYEADLRVFLGEELELVLYQRQADGRHPMHFELFPADGTLPEKLPDTVFEPVFSDEKEPAPENPRRPLMHFTSEKGWINDPNGCFRDDAGLWHLYFQHNPFGPEWGNMHWGHAVSRDLLHWEERGEALLIDQGGMMFSGCAVKDTKNASGLRKDGVNPVLFYYTSAGKESTQCLALSYDNGKTLEKYPGNPLIPQISRGSRDPKLQYDREFDRFLCPLYLKKHEFAIFETKDLLHFTMLQKLELPGDMECPNLYPLISSDGRRLFVFSGAADRYLVGEMREEGFFPVQEERQLSYDSRSYAAQTFFRESDEEPLLRIAWDTSPIPDAPFNCAMSTPQVMGLRKIGESYVLSAEPPAEFTELFEETAHYQCIRDLDTKIGSKAFMITMDFSGAAFDAELSGLRFSADAGGLVIHGIHFPERGPRPAETKDIFLPRIGAESRLRIIADTNSAEFYLNDTALTTVAHDFTEGPTGFCIHSDRPLNLLTSAEYLPQR